MGRRLRRRLRAGAVAARRPGRQPQRLHDRLLAPPSLQLRRERRLADHGADLDRAVRGLRRHRAHGPRPRLRALRAGRSHGRPRARPRHPVLGGRYRGEEPGSPPAHQHPHRRPRQQDVRRPEADPARPGRRAPPRLVPVGVRRRRAARQHVHGLRLRRLRGPAPAESGRRGPRHHRAADLPRAAEPAPVPPRLAHGDRLHALGGLHRRTALRPPPQDPREVAPPQGRDPEAEVLEGPDAPQVHGPRGQEEAVARALPAHDHGDRRRRATPGGRGGYS